MSNLLSLLLLAIFCHVASNQFTNNTAFKLYTQMAEANSTEELRRVLREPLITIECTGHNLTFNGSEFEEALNFSIHGKLPEHGVELVDFNLIDNDGFEFTIVKNIIEDEENTTIHMAKYFATLKDDGLKIDMGHMICDDTTDPANITDPDNTTDPTVILLKN